MSAQAGTLSEGPITSKLCILVDFPSVSAKAQGVPLSGWDKQLITECLAQASIAPHSVCFKSVLNFCPPDRQLHKVNPEARLKAVSACLSSLNEMPNLEVILTLGDLALEATTGKKSIDKWHLSPLDSVEKLNVEKVMPSFSPQRITRQYHLQVYLKMACWKVAEALKSGKGSWPRKEKIFKLNPPIGETLNILDQIKGEEFLSVDIETGRGQINTVGFAWSETEAIAINVLPHNMAAETHYNIWSKIRELLEGPQKKILQNYLYEQLFFSKYGIRLTNVYHDTMIGQKFLWPELKAGLDEVGRIYTQEVYWKDDGKSWNNIRDWTKHYIYNCKDTTGTFEGFRNQEADLKRRNLDKLFRTYIMALVEPITEMCSRGLPVKEENLLALREKVGSEIDNIMGELRQSEGAKDLNPKSPAQVKKFLQDKGYKLPKKYDALTKSWKESTDEKSLKKLKLKYPEDKDLSYFLKLSRLNKAFSSYLNFKYDPDKRMRFTLNAHGTETGRFSSRTDPWGGGMNAQTVPGGGKGINIKSVFEVGEGRVFLQCDLRQAESRFVAYDAADSNLINMLEDSTKDIHKYVAAEIFHKAEKDITKGERQLGKKSGHGANYSMKEGTFIESCLQEMDLVLTKTEATNVLEAYHRLFPGIRLWHERIRQEVRRSRMLKNPLGRERYFYGRMGDDLFREAYAYRPQSTIPDVTNHLMLHLLDERKRGKLKFELLLQVHDSVLLDCAEEDFEAIAEVCLDTDSWHPEIILSAGKLIIPTEVERGKNWGNLKVWGE